MSASGQLTTLLNSDDEGSSAERPAIDAAAVSAWMTDHGLGDAPLNDVTLIGGGTQNVLVRFEHGGRTFVLRRGPIHLRPKSNASIMREARVLRALEHSAVPHPRLIATCADPAVLHGAVFYLMAPIDGFNASIELPQLHASDPSIRHRMGLELADALAKLAEIDYEACGLADFGKPAGFLERQVPRWLAELESYRTYPGYPGTYLPGVREIASWLLQHQPATFSPGIMHGDFHAANVMFSRSGPEVAAIVDWEMSTIGDPLLDLGWLLATWRLPGNPREVGGELGGTTGLADADEIVAQYARVSSRDLSSIPWYTVLACFKLGVLLEGTRARAYAGKAQMDVGQRLHETAVALFERAADVMAA